MKVGSSGTRLEQNKGMSAVEEMGGRGGAVKNRLETIGIREGEL